MSVKLLLNNFIMFLLVSSTGGLIFVFNRNVSYLFLFFTVLFGFFYVGKGLKKSNYYSALLSFTTLFVLFFCNYFFATNFQSLTKYSFNQILSFSKPNNIFMNRLIFSKINFNFNEINKYFLTIVIFVISLFILTSLLFVLINFLDHLVNTLIQFYLYLKQVNNLKNHQTLLT